MRHLLFSLGLVLLLAAWVPRAEAHALLDHAAPAVGSKVNTAPAEVKLWFTEKLDLKSSTVRVLDSKGRQVDKKDLHLAAGNQSLLCVSLPQLPPAKYKVVWEACSLDGHVTKGNFTFRVRK